jgi:hypothetical protein
MQFRLNLQGRGIRGGSHEYADVEAKQAANRNDEAEGAQTETHRSFAKEGAEPTGPHHCHYSAAAVRHVRPTLPVALPVRSAASETGATLLRVVPPGGRFGAAEFHSFSRF